MDALHGVYDTNQTAHQTPSPVAHSGTDTFGSPAVGGHPKLPGRGHERPSGGQHRARWPNCFQSGPDGYTTPNRARDELTAPRAVLAEAACPRQRPALQGCTCEDQAFASSPC
jgi:hypothetical protein